MQNCVSTKSYLVCKYSVEKKCLIFDSTKISSRQFKTIQKSSSNYARNNMAKEYTVFVGGGFVARWCPILSLCADSNMPTFSLWWWHNAKHFFFPFYSQGFNFFLNYSANYNYIWCFLCFWGYPIFIHVDLQMYT